jgi:hypothetical protein
MILTTIVKVRTFKLLSIMKIEIDIFMFAIYLREQEITRTNTFYKSLISYTFVRQKDLTDCCQYNFFRNTHYSVS